jgi:GAF domain-containing protein
MESEHYRQRLDKLFADLEHLAADPSGHLPAIRQELEDLRARLCELEEQFLASQKQDTVQETEQPAAIDTPKVPPTAPILYEKERVDYVYTREEDQALRALPPEAADIIVAPLRVSGQTIGKMEIEPGHEHPLTEEEINLLNAVAQQASLQIQNLRLLAATEQARAEAEAATRRFIHENWQSYLDAIHQSERLGYAYDQTAVTPYLEPAQADGGILESVQVMEEQVGTLYLKPDPARPLTGDDKALVSAVAHQIAQQVENLRLLADATRARAEAEEATRHLTRESWEAYTLSQENAIGFVYDSSKVSPLGTVSLEQDVAFAQPLLVRGEPIGQLAIAGIENISPEAKALAAAIAAQASIHLETLRLSEINEKNAQREQALRQITNSLRSSNNPATIMRTAVRELGNIMGRRTVVQLASPQQSDQAKSAKSNEHESDPSVHQS